MITRGQCEIQVQTRSRIFHSKHISCCFVYPAKTAAAAEDDDHYENSFINDEREEEEEEDEDSDYVPESDDSGKEDIKCRKKEAKAFVRRKK